MSDTISLRDIRKIERSGENMEFQQVKLSGAIELSYNNFVIVYSVHLCIHYTGFYKTSV